MHGLKSFICRQCPDLQSAHELLYGQRFMQLRLFISRKGPAGIGVEQMAQALLCRRRGTEGEYLLGRGRRGQEVIDLIPDIEYLHCHSSALPYAVAIAASVAQLHSAEPARAWRPFRSTHSIQRSAGRGYPRCSRWTMFYISRFGGILCWEGMVNYVTGRRFRHGRPGTAKRGRGRAAP